VTKTSIGSKVEERVDAVKRISMFLCDEGNRITKIV
jgi:hypothetical protein